MQVLRETHAEKCARRRWGFVLWVLSVVLLGAWVSALAGCATLKPPCPMVSLDVVDTEAGQLYVLDANNLSLLLRRMKGLEEQTCSGDRPKGDPA